MTYKEYKDKIHVAVCSRFDGIVEYIASQKINNVVYDGLSMRRVDSNKAVIMYVQEGYKESLHEMEIDTMADEIVERAEKYLLTIDEETGNIEDYMNFNWVKDHIYPVLVNAERNKNILRDCPHRECLVDNSITIIYFVDFGSGTVRVTNKHMQNWEVTEEDLYENAMRNLSSEEYVIDNIMSVIEHNIREKIARMEELSETDIQMIYRLLSNMCNEDLIVIRKPDLVYGARAMLRKDLFKKVLEEFDNPHLKDGIYFALSSVHEVILFNTEVDEKMKEKIHNTILAVNEEVLEKEDFLSDHLYFFNRETEEIEIAG